jgi:hypothetical protein
MTDDPNAQGDQLADGEPPDETTGSTGAGGENDPTPATGDQVTAPAGVDTGTDQPGSPEAEAPDPAGIEAGETQSVPTLRGPGPEDDVTDTDGGAQGDGSQA